MVKYVLAKDEMGVRFSLPAQFDRKQLKTRSDGFSAVFFGKPICIGFYSSFVLFIHAKDIGSVSFLWGYIVVKKWLKIVNRGG